jgi:YegS/Rv2252/BmrU family lipid kinase
MDAVIDSIGQYFRTQQEADFSVLIARYPRDALGLIQKQFDDGGKGKVLRVYAVGGDGMLFDCLNGIKGLPNTELAAIPYGNANDFIRAFGTDKIEAFKKIPDIVTASAIPTDIMDAGINYAVNVCSAGLSAAVVVRTKALNEKMGAVVRSGSLFYQFMRFLSTLGAVFDRTITAQHYAITIDAQDYSGPYSQVIIANGPYYGGGKIAGLNALPNDGLLDVTLFKSAGPLATLWAMSAYNQGKIPANCVVLQAKKITLQSEQPVWIQMDGEFILDTHIDCEIIPAGAAVAAVQGVHYKKPKT